MQRDCKIEVYGKGLPIEADHLQGCLYSIAKKRPIFHAIYANLKVYEQLLNA
ncbi:hypothetical protein PcaKH16_13080 [Parageobacillus caldoxylosilyticus]|uniref:Uncharacterized protein n=1 Tax=Parageobacillus caldoxylosilyticus NBRC 107762 TaxID=1220594 RepID=A0A023DKG2_9BACL|nr:hypothetical protein PcaKH16_13080 [Parageobacillus caldoxylosilyticus]BDG42952.1 hypothetical protein PcaKH35_12970 [Parageobacillus caldoxylosilyticus]GAJ41506.1 hypothetical protein GCA01S_073_00010 [Parageobacillus caldoxylosilyticus NBRC 107762]